MSQEENAGRDSIPIQQELEAWQELAKNFARRLEHRDWHRLNALEILLVEQLENLCYLERASNGFVGKRRGV
jgi:hypothetical protein